MNNDTPRTLRDVAIAALAKQEVVGGRALGRIMKERGLKGSYTTIDKIVAGTYKSRPQRDILIALQVLSGLSRAEVYKAAGEPLPGKPLAEDLPPDADLLDPFQRKVVIDTVRLFAQQKIELATLQAELAKEGTGDAATAAQKSGNVIEGNFGQEDDSYAGPSPEEVSEDLAADEPGEPSVGEQLRDQQDNDGEESQETLDDD